MNNSQYEYCFYCSRESRVKDNLLTLIDGHLACDRCHSEIMFLKLQDDEH